MMNLTAFQAGSLTASDGNIHGVLLDNYNILLVLRCMCFILKLHNGVNFRVHLLYRVYNFFHNHPYTAV